MLWRIRQRYVTLHKWYHSITKSFIRPCFVLMGKESSGCVSEWIVGGLRDYQATKVNRQFDAKEWKSERGHASLKFRERFHACMFILKRISPSVWLSLYHIPSSWILNIASEDYVFDHFRPNQPRSFYRKLTESSFQFKSIFICFLVMALIHFCSESWYHFFIHFQNRTV